MRFNKRLTLFTLSGHELKREFSFLFFFAYPIIYCFAAIKFGPLFLCSIPTGLRSYGKVVYAFGTLPLLGYFIVCVKVLGYSSSIPSVNGVGGVLDRTPWHEFFIDTRVNEDALQETKRPVYYF